MRSLLLLLITIAILSLGKSDATLSSSSADGSMYLGVLYADDGTFSGVGEAKYILEALKNQTKHSIPDCGSGYDGYLLSAKGTKVRTLVVATGIGALNAAMCSRSVLDWAPLTHIIYTGTSGVSRFQKGGMEPLRADGCNAVALNSTGHSTAASTDFKVHPLGSMCVTSAATDLSCGICVHSNSRESLNECSQPDCVPGSHNMADLCGPCSPWSEKNDFAESVFTHAKSIKYPLPTAELKTAENQWWTASGYALSTDVFDTPLVTDRCVETDFRQILASAPAEYQCREYTADALNRNPNNHFSGLTSANVTCFAAMEGIGLLQVTRSRPNLNVVIIRGGSNWGHKPLVKQTETTPSGSPVWFQNLTYASAADQDKMTKDGYAYAIHTTNTLVLSYVAGL